jgi:ribosomal protein L40E
MMQVCDKCDKENKPGAKFCKFCGNKMEAAAPAPAPAPAFPLPSLGSRPPELHRDFSPVTRQIEETGEVLELVDREAEYENMAVLSTTFADTLSQLAQSREELANIEVRIADALKVQRDREEKKLREIQSNYELTQKKIQALEELSLLRKLREGEDKLAAIFRGEDVEISGSILAGIGEEETGEDMEELEDLEDLDDAAGLDELEDLEDLDEDQAQCPECEAFVPLDATRCPNCGVEFDE